MRAKAELHIVIDKDGVRGVQIIGPPETHPEGHDMYFMIQDLVRELDAKLQQRIQSSIREETKQ